MGPERKLETAFLRWLKTLEPHYRFKQWKLQILGMKGYPDRTIKLPGNREICIEFKAPGKLTNTSANQDNRIAELRALDVPVLVSDNLLEAQRWTLEFLVNHPR